MKCHGAVLFLLLALVAPVISAGDSMVCSRCDRAPNSKIAPQDQLEPGDIVLEVAGMTPERTEAFFKKLGQKTRDMKVFPCLALRNGQKRMVYFSPDDYTDWSFPTASETKIPAADLENDLADLFFLLEHAYIDSEKTRSPEYSQAKQNLLAAVSGKSLPIEEAYREISHLLSWANDAHLGIDLRDLILSLEGAFYLRRQGVFPLDIQLYKGDLYARLPAQHGGRTVLVRTIQGQPVEKVLVRMREFLSGDTVGQKNAFIMDNFPLLYYWIFGYQSEFSIGFRDGANSRDLSLAAIPPRQLVREPYGIGSSRVARNILILKIDGFNDDHAFKTLVNSSMDQACARKMPGIVIDLRDNRGGSSQALKYLLLFLENRPFTIYDRWRYRVPKNPKDENDVKAWYLPDIKEMVMTPDKYTTSNGPFFKGKIALLTSGRNYSTAMDCIIGLRNRGNTVVVGQRCGGALVSTGNTISWRGSRTRLKVGIPVSRFFPWHTSDHEKANSLEPDVLVENPPFSRRDHVLERALELVGAHP